MFKFALLTLAVINVKSPSSELIVKHLVTLIWQLEASFTIYKYLLCIILQFNSYVSVYLIFYVLSLSTQEINSLNMGDITLVI